MNMNDYQVQANKTLVFKDKTALAEYFYMSLEQIAAQNIGQSNDFDKKRNT